MVETDLSPLADAPSMLDLVKTTWRKQSFEVTGDGRTFAQVHYTITGGGSARTADGGWEFTRPRGLAHRRVDVTRADSGDVLVSLDLRSLKRGGTVELGGVAYQIRAKGAVNERWRCERDGAELFSIKEIHSPRRGKGRIELTDLGRSDPSLGLLLLLTLDANHISDQTAATAGAGSAAAAG